MKSQEYEKLQNRILEYEVLKQKIIILRDHSTCTDCIHNRFTDIWGVEKYSFENKIKYEIIDKFYEVLLLEAQNKIVDSGFRYLERKREPKERFYMPRRKQFLKIGLVDGEVCMGVYNNREKEWWTRKQEGERWYTNKHNVIAWQPLPEPYKEEKKC